MKTESMSNNQQCLDKLGGTKRRPHHDVHSFNGPSATSKRPRGGNEKYDYGMKQEPEPQNGNQDDSRDTNNDMWNEEFHKQFVSAIFEMGLKNSSPAIILENMTQKVETITSERVKSKLQKYRNNKNKEKSKQEFMTNYCEFLDRIKAIQAEAGPIADIRHYHQGIIDGSSSDPIIAKIMEEIGSSDPNNKKLLLGGDVAGYLTYSVMKENIQSKNGGGQSSLDSTSSSAVLPTNVLRKGAREYMDKFAGCAIQFPVLTEVEKKSSLGIAMTFIAGLFLTMSQHLTRERARAETIGLKVSPTTSINGPDDRTAQKQHR